MPQHHVASATDLASRLLLPSNLQTVFVVNTLQCLVAGITGDILLLDLFQQGVYTGMLCMLCCLLQASSPCMCCDSKLAPIWYQHCRLDSFDCICNIACRAWAPMSLTQMHSPSSVPQLSCAVAMVHIHSSLTITVSSICKPLLPVSQLAASSKPCILLRGFELLNRVVHLSC